jgi:hypothetical protein
MFTRSIQGFVCSSLILAVPRVAEGAKIKLVPVSANGQYSIQNGELYLQHPGQQIVLEVQVSDWALDGDGLIHLVAAEIDSAGFSQGQGSPLVPLFEECPGGADGNAFCDAQFGSIGRACRPASEIAGCPYANCCQPAFLNSAHPHYLLAGQTCNGNFIDGDDPDYSFQFIVHCCCIGIADDGSTKYSGTLALQVPNAALGTYTIGFIESGTGLYDGDNPIEYPMPYTQTPAVIHVEPFAKNRYLTMGSTAPEGSTTAIRVTLVSLYHPDPPPPVTPAVPPDFSAFEGQVRWVGQAVNYLETPDPLVLFTAAPLQCEPFFEFWYTVDTLRLRHGDRPGFALRSARSRHILPGP